MNATIAPAPHDAELQALARQEAFSMPLEEIDVSKPRLFQEDTIGCAATTRCTSPKTSSMVASGR
jgi:hypothetical protein